MSSRAEAEEERCRTCRYKGVRRRRWGKWVSEIRVPGTRERLWLGSYATPEGAAVAHDTAVYFLRGGGSIVGDGGGAAALNFPERAAAMFGAGSVAPLSPRSVQSVASDAGMAADAQLVAMREIAAAAPRQYAELRTADAGAAHGGANEYSYTYMGGGYTPGPGSSGGSEQLLPGDISVDDMEILM